jgi:hypothetical protein
LLPRRSNLKARRLRPHKPNGQRLASRYRLPKSRRNAKSWQPRKLNLNSKN